MVRLASAYSPDSFPSLELYIPPVHLGRIGVDPVTPLPSDIQPTRRRPEEPAANPKRRQEPTDRKEKFSFRSIRSCPVFRLIRSLGNNKTVTLLRSGLIGRLAPSIQAQI